jgi:dynein heavy chain, axonemal
MRESLKSVLLSASADFAVSPRVKFVLSWQSQIVLAIDGVAFTNQVESALSSGAARGLVDLEAQLTSDVTDVIGLVQGEISTLDRMTLGSLIVVDVHSRDVVASLISEGVRGVSDFAWKSQLRYVLNAEAGISGGNDASLLSVLQMTTNLSYGFEYLVTSRNHFICFIFTTAFGLFSHLVCRATPPDSSSPR